MKKILPVIVALFAGACRGPAPQPETSAPEVAPLTSRTIDQLVWSDDAGLPTPIQNFYRDKTPSLLGHVVEWQGFPAMKNFTAAADSRFTLQEEGRIVGHANKASGGVTTESGSVRFVSLWVQDAASLDRSREYSLVPSNQVEGYSWLVSGTVRPPATR